MASKHANLFRKRVQGDHVPGPREKQAAYHDAAPHRGRAQPQDAAVVRGFSRKRATIRSGRESVTLSGSSRSLFPREEFGVSPAHSVIALSLDLRSEAIHRAAEQRAIVGVDDVSALRDEPRRAVEVG